MEMPEQRRALGALAILFACTQAHAAVGRSPGVASVTADGEAAYTVPIQVPPGTNGMTPSLSLEYRHRIAGGLLGVGWGVGGLSQISRCRRTYAQDGDIDLALRLIRDRFCLDGQRLVVANGVAYGAAGAEYRTEIESFARIRQLGGGGGGSPQSFVVEAADGRILEYGMTADSRIDRSGAAGSTTPTLVWALNRIRDRSGNVIDFAYTENTAEFSYRIASIRYNSNPSLGIAASHRIDFVYETRPVNEVDIGHVAGTPFRIIVRLDRIDVFHGTSLLRRYDLAYEPALSASGRSRLASIQECGQGGTDCLAPSVLRWQNGTPGFGAEWALAAAVPTAPVLPAHRLLNSADVNGDGRDDLIYAAGSSIASATIRYRLAAAAGFGAEIDTGVPCPAGIGTPFDYDGDGRSDLLLAGHDGQWRILPGRANGFGSLLATGLTIPPQMVDYRGVDMNGDGLGDIAWSEVITSEDVFMQVQVRLARAGGGFAAEPRLLYSQTPEQGFEHARGGNFLGRPGVRVDLDIDGADDLLMNEFETMTRITVAESWTETFDGGLVGGTPLDMNGDGCTDFAYSHYSGRLRIRVGECGIAWTGTELLGPAWTGARELRAHDWNGDGRDDILLAGPANWQVAVSNGNAFAAIADTGIPHGGAAIAGALDIDGDGLSDLLAHAGGQARLRLRSGPMADLMLSATDGSGVAAHFAYRPLTDPGVYVRGGDVPYPRRTIQSPAYVVAESSRTDGSGTGTLASTRYGYESLRRDLLGRGSLGFLRRTASESSPGEETVVDEIRLQEFPFAGLPSSVTRRLAAGQAYSESSWSWSSLTLGSATASRRFPYPATTTVRRREAIGAYAGAEIATVTRSVAALDPASGAVTDERVTVTEAGTGVNTGASATYRTLHTGLLNDTANWCIGRPTATQVTASHTQPGGNAINRATSQDWDGARCRPTQLRREPGSSQWQLTVDLGYDAFGNVATRTVSGPGVAARTTTLQWGARGQLPAGVTNPAQQSYALSWNLATGLPLSITDPNGLTVSWLYDAFGRLTQESQPAGTSTTWTRTTCTGGCDSRTRYLLTQRRRDSAGIVQTTTVADLDQHDRGFRFSASRPGGGTSVQLFEADARGHERRRHAPFWAGGSSPGYWQFAYDALGRLTGLTLHSAGGSVQRTHTLAHDGLTVTHRDALGRTTIGVRNAWGASTQILDPAGGLTRYEHDALGNLVQLRDPLGHPVTSATYGATGMLLTQTEANSGTWTYTRNALGEITSLRDAKSQIFSFIYDSLGRLVSRTAPEGAITLSWGGSAAARNIGRLTGIAGPGYSESYAYDAYGRLATRTITSDATYQYDLAYDAFGQPSSLTYPAAGPGSRFRIAFEHQAGQAVRVRDANTSSTLWQLGAQDAAGNPVDESLGASLRIVSGFDPITGLIDYRRTTAGGAVTQDLDYHWDAGDNLASRRDLLRNLLEEFRYDALDRLDDTRLNGTVNLDLDYDATGNIRWKSDVCPTSAPCYVYDPVRRHAATAVAGQAYAYDVNGNMTGRGGAAISWTSANLPSHIAGTGGNSSQFWYGPAGNRWKQVAADAGITETTVYAGELMEKVVRGGTTTWRHYVPTPSGIAAVHLRQGNNAPAATRYLTRDHLGSIDGILDEGGGILASTSYAPFGRRRGTGWSGMPSGAELSAIAAVTRDGFTGHEHLDNLGLIHMGGRAYDPKLGRFLSADPHVTAPFNSQSLNRYSYVWNNPLSLVDPSGFDPEIPCMQAANGACAQVTVIGAEWADFMRALFRGGAGAGQAASAAQRDPCGQDGSAIACAMQRGALVSPSTLVLSVGTQPDSALASSAGLDRIQGMAATVGNLAISASPVTWLFGADPNFEWFDVPDSAAGRAGATLGNVGYFLGGIAGVVRSVGAPVAGQAASQSAQAFQISRNYSADRFRDITLRKGTTVFSGHPGQSAFYTTASALSRADWSASALFAGLQVARHRTKGLRTRIAAYEVLEDTPAAFGRALANDAHGAGGLPQIAIPAYERVLRYLGDYPLGP